MKTMNLQKNYPSLIEHLRANGYSQRYIGEIEKCIKQVLRDACNPNVESYEDYYYGYVKNKYTKANLRTKRACIGMIKQFDLYGKFPSCDKPTGFLKKDKYATLSTEFKGIIHNYEISAKERGLGEKTIYDIKCAAKKFFSYQQSLNHHSSSEITEQDTLEYFYNSGKMTRGCGVVGAIRCCLRENTSLYPACSRLISYLPAIPHRKKVYDALTETEAKKISSFLLDPNSNINYRDRAIMIIAFFTGLRGCDICEMKLENIDWKHDFISLIQSKTHFPVLESLRPVIGNAIYDYIHFERPNIECDYLFLTRDKDIRQITTYVIKRIVKTTFKKIGIRQDGGKIGLHLFRHYLVTRLLGKGVATPVISSILGHESPESLTPYLSADLVHLKECALSIEEFPVRKGVLL